MKNEKKIKDKNDDQCISSRMLGSLGLGASGSVITCMHKIVKEIHQNFDDMHICMQDQRDTIE